MATGQMAKLKEPFPIEPAVMKKAPLTTKKKIRLAVTSGLLTIVFLFTVSELATRIYYFGPDTFSYGKMKSFRPIFGAGVLQYSDHAEIGFELKPGLNTWFKLERLQTNSAGLRDKEYSFEKSLNTKRVAVVGDSYTLPSGVAIEEAWHSLLEAWMTENDKNRSFEFINFGVGGYDLTNYLGVIEHKVFAYDPDMILIGFCGPNDDWLVKDEVRETAYKIGKAPNPFFKSWFVEFLKNTFQRPGSLIWKKSKRKTRRESNTWKVCSKNWE